MHMEPSEVHGPLSTGKGGQSLCGVSLEVPNPGGSGERRCPSSSSTAVVPAPQSKPADFGAAVRSDGKGHLGC